MAGVRGAGSWNANENIAAGVTTLTSFGDNVVPLTLPQRVQLLHVDVVTESEYAALYFGGPDEYFLFKAGADWIGIGPGDVSGGNYNLAGGSYSIYLAPGEHAMNVVLTFSELAGTASFPASQPVKAFREPLPRVGSLDQLPQTQVLKYGGTHAMDGPTIGGFFVRHLYQGPITEKELEFRWSTETGVDACLAWGSTSVGVHLGSRYSRDGAVHPFVTPGDVHLEFFLDQTVAELPKVVGYWIERAPDDHVRPAQLQPLLWGLDPTGYDVLCALERV